MKQCLNFAFVPCALLQTLSPQWTYTVIPWIPTAFVFILRGLRACGSPQRALRRSPLPAGLVSGHSGHLCPRLRLPQVPNRWEHPPRATACGCVGRGVFSLVLGFVFKMKSFHCWNGRAVLDFSGTRIFPVKRVLFPSLQLIIVPHIVT